VDTAGTGLSKSGSTFNVNAAQTQITQLGTITTGTWNANCIANAYLCDTTDFVDTAGTGLSKSGSTFNVNAHQTQITKVGTINTGTWQATAIQDNYISSSNTWHGKIDTAGTGLSKSGTTLTVNMQNNNNYFMAT